MKANRAVLGRYGAKFLVRWGKHEFVEGAGRSRQVVIEFPDYAAALGCYNDPEYQAAHKLREAGTTGDLCIVEGVEGPVPNS